MRISSQPPCTWESKNNSVDKEEVEYFINAVIIILKTSLFVHRHSDNGYNISDNKITTITKNKR